MRQVSRYAGRRVIRVDWYVVDRVLLRGGVCGVCRRQDHHCVWVDNCVGRENSRPFWVFLLSLACLILMNFYLLSSYFSSRSFLQADQVVSRHAPSTRTCQSCTLLSLVFSTFSEFPHCVSLVTASSLRCYSRFSTLDISIPHLPPISFLCHARFEVKARSARGTSLSFSRMFSLSLNLIWRLHMLHPAWCIHSGQVTQQGRSSACVTRCNRVIYLALLTICCSCVYL